MWIPQYIEIKNILSHVDTFYNFNQKEPVLLLGVNNDLSEPGRPKRSNGSGKSTFIDAISICLTGDSIRNVKLSELVRNGEPYGEVEMGLFNTVHSREMNVYWKIYSGSSPTEYRVHINGQEQKQIPSVLEAKKFVLEQLGVTKDDIYNYFVVSKGSYKAFFSSSDNEKKEIINRFSQANLIDPVIKNLESQGISLQNEYNQLNTQISTLNSTLAELESQLKDAEVDDRESKIVELQSRIRSCEEIISQSLVQKRHQEGKLVELSTLESKAEQDWLDTKQELEELRSSYQESLELQKSFNLQIHGVQQKYSKEYDSVTETEKKTNNLLIGYRKELSELQHQKIELESFLSGLVECPECKARFSLKPGLTIPEAEAKLKECNLTIKSKDFNVELCQKDLDKLPLLRKEIDDKVNKDTESLKESYNEVSEIVQELDRSIKDKEDLVVNKQRHLENLSLRKTTLTSEIRILGMQVQEKSQLKDTLLQSIEQLQAGKDRAVVDVLEKQIEKIQIRLDEYSQLLDSANIKLSGNKEWLQHFLQFKSFLANKSISSISGYTNLFLQKMGTPLRVLIDGFKTLKDNTVREKINIQVTRDGTTPESFQKFSGGERSACEIAFILTLQKLFNLSCDSGGLNLLVLDEVVESLDMEGINEVFKPLVSLNQCILLITHGNINAFQYNHVVFEKTNNQTQLIE